jgi:hypothetical protein
VNDVKENVDYLKVKEEALDRTVCRLALVEAMYLLQDILRNELMFNFKFSSLK